MPALGMAQETGKVLRWLKSEGDAVAKGEPLLEIETDKVTVEIEAPADGQLAGIRAAEGDDVPVGETIAVLLAAGETLAAAPAGAGRGRSCAGRRGGARRRGAGAGPPAARLAEGAAARGGAWHRPRGARRQRARRRGCRRRRRDLARTAGRKPLPSRASGG